MTANLSPDTRPVAEPVRVSPADAALPSTATPDPLRHASALAALAQRHSVGPRWLTDPAPDDTALRRALACALRAPDHGLLRPWRAVLVPREHRAALGDLFAAIAREQGRDDHEIARERERAERGPALVAWIARIAPGIDDVPEHEQWIATGGALTLFLSALHLMGYGAKTLSGRKCAHPLLRQAFCQPDETLVAFVAIGTPTRTPRPRGCDDLDDHWRVWHPGGSPGTAPMLSH